MRTRVVALSVLVWCGVASADSLVYYSYRQYRLAPSGTRTTPFDMAVRDVNHDTVPDVVVATAEGASIQILLGTAAGQLRVVDVHAATPPASRFALGDFNGDGHVDVATAWAIHFGRGDGRFDWSAEALPSGCSTVSSPTHCRFAAGDFNADGRDELIVGENSVSLFSRTASGVWTRNPLTTAFPFRLAASIITEDLDGNGTQDVVAGFYRQAIVLLNRGDGAFARADYGLPGHPNAIAPADLNGDGSPELVVADGSSASILILRNEGSGTFALAHVYHSGCTREPYLCALNGIVSEDFNGDGFRDVATPFSLLFGKGDTTLAAAVLLPTDGGGSDIGAARFSPGRAHVLLANSTSWGGNISVIPVVRPPVPRSVPAGNNPRHVLDGDFNRDGSRDLAVAIRDENRISIHLANGNGTFARPIELEATLPATLAQGDFDQDGVTDLAAGGLLGTWIFLGNGDATFRRGAWLDRLAGGCEDPGLSPRPCLAAGDVDADGILDLLGIDPSSPVDAIIALGNGDGTFRDPRPLGRNVAGFTLADFDLDGRVDLVTTGFFQLQFHRGNGDGTFAAPVDLLRWEDFRVEIRDAVAADMNQDGRLDLMACGGGSSSQVVLFMPGNGDGTFGPLTALPTDSGPQSLAIADLNVDGFLDIVSANWDGDNVAVFAGAGDGRFFGPILYGVGDTPARVVTPDLNGDGRPDIVTVNPGSDDLTVILHARF